MRKPTSRVKSSSVTISARVSALLLALMNTSDTSVCSNALQHFETATAQQPAAAGLFQTIPRWARHKGSAPVTCGCSGNLGGRDGSILAFLAVPSGLAGLDSSTANLFVASDSS